MMNGAGAQPTATGREAKRPRAVQLVASERASSSGALSEHVGPGSVPVGSWAVMSGHARGHVRVRPVPTRAPIRPWRRLQGRRLRKDPARAQGGAAAVASRGPRLASCPTWLSIMPQGGLRLDAIVQCA